MTMWLGLQNVDVIFTALLQLDSGKRIEMAGCALQTRQLCWT